jgi:hypothetical protein
VRYYWYQEKEYKKKSVETITLTYIWQRSCDEASNGQWGLQETLLIQEK